MRTPTGCVVSGFVWKDVNISSFMEADERKVGYNLERMDAGWRQNTGVTGDFCAVAVFDLLLAGSPVASGRLAQGDGFIVAPSADGAVASVQVRYVNAHGAAIGNMVNQHSSASAARASRALRATKRTETQRGADPGRTPEGGTLRVSLTAL
ncbi:hypothetical protein JT358_00130 [Micrococcales bacterium 31B]|nr:hypothetical protein [Micrococcales bacterium 31B]